MFFPTLHISVIPPDGYMNDRYTLMLGCRMSQMNMDLSLYKAYIYPRSFSRIMAETSA
jgi:hypothetical protein